jgi:prepilin-type N-terminal cleavage/methylation domain-containing protein
MILRTSQPRAGLTLLEVIVAMAIFLMSMVAIHQLVSIGTDRAIDVKWQSRTSLRCQSKLNEIMVGAEQLSGSGGYTPFTDDPDLQWKMEATTFDPAGLLYTVKVSVQVDPSKTNRTIETQLVQMVLNPANRGSTMDQPLPTPAGTPTTNSSATPSASAATTPAAGAGAAPAAGKGKAAGGGAAAGGGKGTGKAGGGGATPGGGKGGGGGATPGGGITTPGGGAGKTGGAVAPGGGATAPTAPSTTTPPAAGRTGGGKGG